MYQKIEIQNENLQLHLIHCKSLEGKKKSKKKYKSKNYGRAKSFLLN